MKKLLEQNPTHSICISNEKTQGENILNTERMFVKYFTGFDQVTITVGVECALLSF